MRGLQLLLIFLPVALLAQFARIDEIFVFATSALAIIPLAKILGEATEVWQRKQDNALAVFSMLPSAMPRS